MSIELCKSFIELQSNFYSYMVRFGGIAPKTARDYVTRLKFLSKTYKIDPSMTQDRIEDILSQENINRLNRSKYGSKKSMSDFRSGLNKFYAFIKFNYEKQIEIEIDNEVKKIRKASDLTKTEKESIVRSRIGQGAFRKNLIDYWKTCSFKGCNMTDLLIASHIKPWRISNNTERLDVFNGLLLLPNYDKLFDLGYITVNMDGKIIISKFLPVENISKFCLNNLSICTINERHKPYLKYHKINCFMG